MAFIQFALKDAHCNGIVYGNSGGKDSALVGILCKLACENTVGVAMPCQSSRNFGEDMEDALAVAEQFHIETLTVDPVSYTHLHGVPHWCRVGSGQAHL